MVKTANDIYAQVGVTFDLGDRIVVTNIPAAYDINEISEADGRWNLDRLTDLASGTGGLECYFVNTITRLCDDGGTEFLRGLHAESGLAVASSVGGVILAHELGHAFGMSDIYCEDGDTNPFFGLTREEYWIGDWNGGSSSQSQGVGAERYYIAGTEHTNVVRRLLMDGRKRDPGFGIDISYGGARGFGTDNAIGDQDTGFFSPERTGDPQHR